MALFVVKDRAGGEVMVEAFSLVRALELWNAVVNCKKPESLSDVTLPTSINEIHTGWVIRDPDEDVPYQSELRQSGLMSGGDGEATG